ncbi:MAG: thioredoxin family protein [Hydrococcus sp. CSU_1_8]|nr:thioredoxin family protein [Hydrococcus sp. CSU_1_8]
MNTIQNRAKFSWKLLILRLCLVMAIEICASGLFWETSPARADINDDRLDGNIFVVYAGNGSLVPPRLTLGESLKRKMPVILVYYLDDNSDCKQFAIVVSRMQEFYGRAASIIPVSVDSLPVKANYSPDELGYYYEGVIPQTVILDETGKMVFNGKGQVKYEAVDDVLRKVFDLVPRAESVQLKRRSFNEFNTELVDN